MFNLKLSYLVFDFFLILISSYMVVTLNNPIFSVLFLILVFIVSSVLFMLIGMKFIGFTLLIVYLGAVVVLFLFIVMLLNIKILELRRNINFYPFLFICFSAAIVSFFNFYFFKHLSNFSNFYSVFQALNLDWLNLYFYKDSFVNLGLNMYTFYSFYFLSASIILFIAMIGSIVLTLSQLKKGKKQVSYLQIIRTRSSLFLVKN